MLRIFKSKKILSEQDFKFQFETFKWLLRNFGGDDFYKDTELVFPTKKYFPTKVTSKSEAASVTFEAVKKHAGLEHWPCKLEEQEEDINPLVAPTMAVQNTPSNPHGTFGLDESEEIIITYNPSLLANPVLLVSTFAHELAHYLTSTAPDEPPGGWENWEFATDIAATFLGFGIFMANSSVNFNQFSSADSQGWQYNRSGYLTEAEHCVALAFFIELKNISLGQVETHLKPNLRKLLKQALKEIQAYGVVQELKRVEYVPFDS